VFWSAKKHLGGRGFTDYEEVETEVWKWLRQQSKDFYAVDFDALVKQWDKCINVIGAYKGRIKSSGNTCILLK
jgi:hypothetical protein